IVLAAQPPPRGKPYLSTPRFVGRDRELAEVRAFLRATLGFQPAAATPDTPAAPLPAQVLVLRGEPGVGKSRLLGQIHREAHALDGPSPLVLVGQCVRGGGGPYHSLNALLEALEHASADTSPPDP